MGEEKTEEESKPKDEESKEEEMKVKEAVDTEDTQNESESTEKTTEAEKAEQLVLFTEKYEASPSKRVENKKNARGRILENMKTHVKNNHI